MKTTAKRASAALASAALFLSSFLDGIAYQGLTALTFFSFGNDTMLDDLVLADIDVEVQEPGGAALLLAGLGLLGVALGRRMVRA